MFQGRLAVAMSRKRSMKDSEFILVHILLRNVNPRGSFDYVTLDRNMVVSLDPEVVAVLDRLTIEQPNCDLAHRHSGELWIPEADRLDCTRFDQVAAQRRQTGSHDVHLVLKPSFLDRLSDADGIVRG